MHDCLERYVMSKISHLAMKYVEDKEMDDLLLRRMDLLSFVTPEVGSISHSLRLPITDCD